MCKATTADIRNRIRCLHEEKFSKNRFNVNYLLESLSGAYNFKMATHLLEDWQQIDPNTNVAFTEVMRVFDLICENDSISNINKSSNFIVEEVIPKVRDGQQTQIYIKRKIGRLKTKLSTKINNNIENMENAVSNSVEAANKNLNASISDIKSGMNKDKVVESCLENILEASTIYVQCDRLLANHNRLSGRFNIDKVVSESIKCENDIPKCIHELCALIDTYSIPLGIKYNVALENIMYAFEKNAIHYNRKTIVDEATDYFLFNIDESFEFNDVLKDMAHIVSDTKFYKTEEVKEALSILTKDFVNFDESKNIRSLKEFTMFTENEKMENPVKNLLNKFKSEEDKSESAIKSLITKIYTKPASNIIDETPNMLNILRTMLIAGTLAINVVLGCIVIFTDQCIRMKIQRKETEKFIDKYKKEKEKAQKLLDSAKTEEDKNKYKKYIAELDKSIRKLNDYYENLHTDDENMNRSSDDDDTFNFDDSWDEATTADITKIMYMEDLLLSIEKLGSFKEESVVKLPLDVIDNISIFSNQFPEIIDQKTLSNILKKDLDDIRQIKESKTYLSYMTIDCLSENISRLNTISNESDKELTLDENISKYTYIKEFMENLNDVIYCINNVSPLLEMNFSNTLKLASDRLKKLTQGLSDKEKTTSRTIDSSVNQFRDKLERSAKNGNREAVIRGDILPPASKCIKTAIISGAAWAINPAIAVIGVLGAIGSSKNMKTHERQLILDDIEIELQMCDKYIKLAEDNNDMKALKELLQTQRALQRQQQRLKYKMSVVGNQKLTSPVKGED